jgi:HEAT repeat protein
MEVSVHASTMLAGMGEKVVPYLVRALREDRSDARGRLLTTLGMMGPAAEGAIQDISALLHDQSSTIRVTAAATLVNIDCERRLEAWPTLVAALEGDAFSASMAASTVGYLGADGAAAVPALIRLLSHSDGEVRLRAISALRNIGPAAQSAIPALDEVAKESGPVGTAAQGTIEKIKGKGISVPSCSDRRRLTIPR